MSNALKCDRCGKFFEAEADKEGCIEIKRFENRGNDKYPPIGWACKDLCPECQKQIQMWFDGEVMFIRKMKPETYAKLSKIAEPLNPEARTDKKKTMNPGEVAKYCLSDIDVTMHSLRYIVNEAIDNTLKWAWTTSVDEMDRVMRERGLEESE